MPSDITISGDVTGCNIAQDSSNSRQSISIAELQKLKNPLSMPTEAKKTSPVSNSRGLSFWRPAEWPSVRDYLFSKWHRKEAERELDAAIRGIPFEPSPVPDNLAEMI